MIIIALNIFTIICSAVAVGFSIAAVRVARRASLWAERAAQAQEIVERLAPPRRHPGTPTNMDAEPSRVSQPRIWGGRSMPNDPHER